MSKVDPAAVYDELFEPLALALGHLVFAAAILEDAMLADLIQRRVEHDGPAEVFGKRLVSQLERRPAGALLVSLRAYGYEEDLAEEIAEVVAARNQFVHHLFSDPEFISVVASREGIGKITARVEGVTENIYEVVKRLEPDITIGMQRLFGRSAPELLSLLREIDPNEFEDDFEREQLEALQGLPDDMIGK